MFAFLAIWCLGCSSFEPLLDAAFGQTSSAQSACMSNRSVEEQSATPAFVTPNAGAGRDAALGCGCSHCFGVQVAPDSPAIAVHPAFDTAARKLGRALTIDNEPLVPPPQGRVIA